MNLELIIQQKQKVQLQEDTSLIRKTIDTIRKLPWKKAKSLLQKSFRGMVKFARSNGIEDDLLRILNKLMDNQYNKLQDIVNTKVNESVNESSWWDEAKGSMFGAASFYPLLQAFIELDKVVKDSGQASMGYVGVYGLIWAAVISGKVVKDKVIDKSVNKAKSSKNKKLNDLYASM